MDVTDEMVNAALASMGNELYPDQMPYPDTMKRTLAAALSAAPTDPHVRCTSCGVLSYGTGWFHEGCYDPTWQRLLLGPEIE